MKTNSADIEFYINIEYEYSPFKKGTYDKLPENCFPDEPETIELTNVWFGDSDILGVLEEQDIKRIKSEISDIENRRA
jgi:hypothetical protein